MLSFCGLQFRCCFRFVLCWCTRRSKQVWDNCKELDRKVGHGPSFAFLCVGRPFLSLSLYISLFNPKMDKKERPKTCSQLKTRNLSLCLYISLFNPKMDKKERSKHAGPQLKRRKNKDSKFYIVWMQSHSFLQLHCYHHWSPHH